MSAEINGQDWRNRSKVPRARDGDRAWSSWDHADKQSNIHHTAYTPASHAPAITISSQSIAICLPCLSRSFAYI